jgi:chemotaxis protein methyltransferase CheR
MTLSTAEFSFVSDLVRRESAIVLEPGKEYLVEARLTPLARSAGLNDVAGYVRHVQSTADRRQRWAIVEALTTNETSWFRDAGVFEGFRTVVLPTLLSEVGRPRTLRVWSAAASTGQEAYSLAITLSEALGPGWRYEILGTDLSSEVLDRAKAGRYSQMEMNRGLPVRHLVRYFSRTGVDWEINAELRKNITFHTLNLALPFPPMPKFDVVFMRNVLIYFDLATKQSILRRVRQVMTPEGWLFLGTAETTRGIDQEFEHATVAGATAYRARTHTAPQPMRRA